MKQRHDHCYTIWVLIMLITYTSCEHIPTKPVVKYDSDNAVIHIIQTDTAAHDSAFISMGGVFNDTIPIKDTITLSVEKSIKKQNQIEFAHKLATNNYQFNVSVHTTRTNDTTFLYKYHVIDITPIKVAEVIMGECVGFYDVNFKRDYHGKIRQWIFNNDLMPDSTVIEKTNSILRQFNYSGKHEYGALNSSVPIVASLSGLKYKFKTQLDGDYYYLYTYSCKSGTSIKSFVESRITKGLTDAHYSLDDEFTCSNKGDLGPNVLFLIGIDKNWKYEALPVGIVVVDDVAPNISTRRQTTSRYGLRGNYFFDNNPSVSWPKTVVFSKQNILINIPNIPSNITSSVSVAYGDFEGNDYFGYNIPFYVHVNGDVQSITIGSHILNRNSIKNGECIHLHIRSLHIGDNVLPVSATDSRGNKSASSISIPIVAVRNNTSYYDDNDYEDLEGRISDLESRMDDLDD